MQCGQCGQVHQRCRAHRRSDGLPCGTHPVKGTPVCRMHGGSAPQVKAAAEARQADAMAQAAVRRLLDDPSAPPVKDPYETLSRLAGRLENAVDVIGERASDLTSVGIVTAAGGEQLRSELRLWDVLLGHLRGALNDLIRAGFADRELRLAERDAELMGQLVAVALDAAGANGEARTAGVAAARDRYLMLVSGAA